MGGGGELESGGAPSGDRSTSFWARVQSHKIIQWGLGYLGAALALAQGAELVGNTFDWPDVVGRALMLGLIAGLPVALALAWYPEQVYAIWRPVYRDMRKLPRFEEFARQIGLVDYWKQYGWPDVCRPFGENDFECD